MLRYIATAVVAILLTLHPQQASATWRHQECRYESLQPGLWTQVEENRTARCVVDHFTVPGGFDKLSYVASCESSWNRLARNGDYVSLFQHDIDYWPSRVRAFEPAYWDLAPSPFNSRTQIVVTARMARASGWDAWPTCGS